VRKGVINCSTFNSLPELNCTLPWASAHRGKWGQLTSPEKMDEKLKSENMHKGAVFYVYILRVIRAGRCRERRYVDHIFIQIYFRMHHFVVKFSKFSSPQAAIKGPP